MAQIVIFAPPGEDVSAGEEALKSAGHDVEVVEATAVNLLHMAVGMMDDTAEEPAEEPAPEPEAEEPEVEAAPAEDAEPAVEEPSGDEATKEGIFYHGNILVDEEEVAAYVSDRAKTNRVYGNDYVSEGQKVTYSLNESVFGFWNNDSKQALVTLDTQDGNHTVSVGATIGRSAGKPFAILNKTTAQRLGLL